MSHGVRVKCPDCEAIVEHSCRSDVREAVHALLSWVPEYGFASPELTAAFEATGRKTRWIDETETVKEHLAKPFFGSQSWSYPLFEKEEARTFHALIHNLVRAIGINPYEIEDEVHRELLARGVEKAATEEARTKRRVGNEKRKK